MIRLVAVLLLFLAVAPLAGSAWIAAEDQCGTARECNSGGPCDASCTLACCAGRTAGLTADTVHWPPDDLPAASTPTASIPPISAPPTDILHVPKSA